MNLTICKKDLRKLKEKWKNFNWKYYPTDIYFFKNKNYDLKYCNYNDVLFF